MNTTTWLTLMLFIEYGDEAVASDEPIEIEGLPELED